MLCQMTTTTTTTTTAAITFWSRRRYLISFRMHVAIISKSRIKADRTVCVVMHWIPHNHLHLRLTSAPSSSVPNTFITISSVADHSAPVPLKNVDTGVRTPPSQTS